MPLGKGWGLAAITLILISTPGVRLHAGDDDLGQRAFARLDLMHYDEAAALFAQALGERPARTGLRVGLAYALFMLNEPAKAIAILDAERAAVPVGLKPLVLKAYVEYASGRETEAEATAREFRSAVAARRKDLTRRQADRLLQDLSPNTGLPAFLLGLCAGKRGEAGAAQGLFTEAQSSGYDRAACWLEAVRIEMESGDIAEARRLWDCGGDLAYALATRPAPPAAPAKPESTPSPGLKNFDPAFVPKTAAAPKAGVQPPAPRKNPLPRVPAEAFILNAFLCDREGNAASAGDGLRQAASLAPFDTAVLREAAGAWLARGEFDQAAGLLRRVRALDPLDFQAGFLLEQAAMRRLTAADPAQALERIAAAHAYVRYRYAFSGDAKKAAEGINRETLALIKAGNLGKAGRVLRRFLESFENSPTLYYNLGQVDNALGLYAEAGASAVKAILLKADFRDAYDLAGNVCYKTGDLERSFRYYAEAARLSPQDPLAFYNLGCACNERGDAAGAEKNWLQAIALEKARPMKRPWTEAREGKVDFDVRVAVEPVSAPACLNLGLLYGRLGRHDEAFGYFGKAAAFNPALAAPHLEMGRLYLRLDEPDKAEACFKKYLDLGGDKRKLEAARLERKQGRS